MNKMTSADFNLPNTITATYLNHMGDDLEVVNDAKVSFGRMSEWGEDGQLKIRDIRLLNYLARGMQVDDFDTLTDDILSVARDADMPEAVQREAVKDYLASFRDTPLHRSPFNHCFLKFHVVAPIHTARQLVKHEYMPWNEMSGRYIEFQPVFHLPKALREKVQDKKQGSGDPLTGERLKRVTQIRDDAHKWSFEAYKALMDADLCEEQARGVLPLDLMTQWRWSGSLGAFGKMVKLRVGKDAQDEATEVADQISAQIAPRFPHAWNALMTYGTKEVSA